MHQGKKQPREPQSLLDILWQCRAENCPKINEVMTENYRELEKHLSSLSENGRDAAMDAVFAICAEKQRLAF